MLIFYNNKFSKLIEEPSKDTNISFLTDFKHSPCFSSACKYTSQIDHIFFYSCKNLLALLYDLHNTSQKSDFSLFVVSILNILML